MPSHVLHRTQHHAHALCRWVEHAVGLSPLCVADEDPQRAVIVELPNVVQLLDEGKAAEDV